MNIQTKHYTANQVIISTEDFERLLEIARRVAPVEIEETDFDRLDLMRLAETGGALDFMRDAGEDVYTVEDLKVKYK